MAHDPLIPPGMPTPLARRPDRVAEPERGRERRGRRERPPTGGRRSGHRPADPPPEEERPPTDDGFPHIDEYA